MLGVDLKEPFNNILESIYREMEAEVLFMSKGVLIAIVFQCLLLLPKCHARLVNVY